MYAFALTVQLHYWKLAFVPILTTIKTSINMLWGMNIVDSLFLSNNAMVGQKRHNGQNITGQVIKFCSLFIIQAVAAVQLVVHCCTPSSWATDNAAGE